MIWLLAAIFGIGFGFISYQARLLTAGGALAGGLFAVSLVVFGGVAWIAPPLTFFLLSSLLSRIRSRRRAAAEKKYEKGHVRDAGQVLANGGVGWTLLVLHAAYPDPILYWGFLGAFLQQRLTPGRRR